MKEGEERRDGGFAHRWYCRYVVMGLSFGFALCRLQQHIISANRCIWPNDVFD